MAHYSRSHEPIAWSLFGGGGMILAFLTPALIIVTGFMLPLLFGDNNPEMVYQQSLLFLQSWIGKIAFLAIVSLQLYHAAHRLFHGMHDLHIGGPEKLMLLIFYGGATLLTVLTAVGLLIL